MGGERPTIVRTEQITKDTDKDSYEDVKVSNYEREALRTVLNR